MKLSFRLCCRDCAGCPAAVANLWDVTDLDIDRFARGVLDQWLGEASLGWPCPSHRCLLTH